MNKDSSWSKYKGYIIGAVIIALVVTILVPAEISVSSRSMDEYDENKGQIANIKLVDKTDGYALFEVLGYTEVNGAMQPSNFYIAVSISLNNIAIGTKGCLGTTSPKGLSFDGSYQYKYDFLFPREGNLLQSLLTRFGIVNFNLPYQGHIEGLVDPSTLND